MSDMKVILFGATGMIGKGVLLECLDDPGIESVLSIGRRSAGLSHPKLRELLHQDFLDYGAVEDELSGYDVCLYCLGISAAGMSEADYRRITYEFAVAAAEVLLRQNPGMRIGFISGAGTDLGARAMWARVKAETEQALLEMPWAAAHMFRPAGIFPRRGVVSSVRSYRIAYGMLGWAYPIFRWLMPNQVTTTPELGQVMIAVARDGYERPILEGADINAVAAKLAS